MGPRHPVAGGFGRRGFGCRAEPGRHSTRPPTPLVKRASSCVRPCGCRRTASCCSSACGCRVTRDGKAYYLRSTGINNFIHHCAAKWEHECATAATWSRRAMDRRRPSRICRSYLRRRPSSPRKCSMTPASQPKINQAAAGHALARLTLNRPSRTGAGRAGGDVVYHCSLMISHSRASITSVQPSIVDRPVKLARTRSQ